MDVHIRLARKGKTFTIWWNKKEKDEWAEVDRDKTLDLKDPIEIGIYAENCEVAGKGNIQYEYFRGHLEPFSVLPEQKLPVTWGAIKGSRKYRFDTNSFTDIQIVDYITEYKVE